MKKYMDKFKRNIHVNKNLFIFVLVIVIVGITAGALFSVILGPEDKELVTNYLNSFFDNLKSGDLNYSSSFVNNLFFTLGFGILIWLLGISVIGFFIVLFMLFLKSFILGFSTGSIIINFKLKGVLLGLIYIFPHQVINILVYMMLSAYALIMSFKIISCFSGKRTLNFKNIFYRYIFVLLVSIFVFVFTGLYEIYVMPYLLNFILGILK